MAKHQWREQTQFSKSSVIAPVGRRSHDSSVALCQYIYMYIYTDIVSSILNAMALELHFSQLDADLQTDFLEYIILFFLEYIILYI